MLWCAYVALVAVGLLLKRSRAYDVATCVFMGLLAYLNTGAADYQTLYLPSYADPGAVPDLEPGWAVLCQLGNAIGLSYNAFACVLTLATMWGLHAFATRTVRDTSVFLALFLVYPGLMSLVQFRQFVASAFVAAGMLALSRRDARGIAGFVACMALAGSLHKVALLMLGLVAYLPLAWLYHAGRLRKRAAIGVCVGYAVVACVLVAFARPIGTALFGEFKTLAYLHLIGVEQGNLSGAASFAGGLRNAVYLVGAALIVGNCARLLLPFIRGIENTPQPEPLPHGEDRSSTYAEAPASQRLPSADFVLLVAIACVAMVALVPFAFITNDFMRLQRYLFVPMLALFANMPAVPLAPKTPRLWTSVWPYLAVCGLFCYSLVIKGTFETVFVPLLTLGGQPLLGG